MLENYGINIYNQDCLEAMRLMPDNAFDLAIVDPPYGINMDGGKIGIDGSGKAKIYKQKDWDKTAPTVDYFIELKRVSKNQIIWGANHFIGFIPEANSSCWIVWDKVKVGDFFADCELAYTSFDTAVRMFKWQWHGMLQGDMANKETRIHPTQKPVALYKWLLDKYAKEGDKILDTHGGSMSIAIACYEYGFNLDIYELDKDYFEAGKQRVENYIQSHPKLF